MQGPPDNASAKPSQGITYLASYPRSSNTWIRYIIEGITKRPTQGCVTNPHDIPICQESVNHLSDVDQDADYVVRKTHGEEFIGKDHSASDRCILITRDPATVIKKQGGGKIRLKEMRSYLQILNEYDRWPGDKVHLHFRDLMNSPEKFITQLVLFIDQDIPTSRITSFLSEMDKYKKDSQRFYDQADKEYTKAKKNVTITKLDHFRVKIYFFLTGKSHLLWLIRDK